MSKAIKHAIVFYGVGIFCLLLGLGLNESTVKEKSIKYILLFSGISIIGLYAGLSWRKPSYGGGIIGKYAAIFAGILCGLYSIYLLVKLL